MRDEYDLKIDPLSDWKPVQALQVFCGWVDLPIRYISRDARLIADCYSSLTDYSSL